MGRLILLNRTGIQVITGRIVNIYESALEIENDCNFQKPRITESRTIVLHSTKDKISALKPKLNAFIMATICPNDATKSLANGVYSNQACHAKAYNIRYTGSFDFDAAGNQPEAHIFCGTVVDTQSLKVGGTLVRVSWKVRGADKITLLYTKADIANCLGNKAIFTVGHKKVNQQGSEFFIIKNLCNVL